MAENRQRQQAHKARKAKARADHAKTFGQWRDRDRRRAQKHHSAHPMQGLALGMALSTAAAGALQEVTIARLFGERFRP